MKHRAAIRREIQTLRRRQARHPSFAPAIKHDISVAPAIKRDINHERALPLFGRCISLPRRRLFIWPVHPYHCAAISSAGGRILTAAPPYHILAGVAMLPYHISASASHCRANLSHFGWRIQSPRHHRLSRLAHPIAYFGRPISSPRHHCLSWLAHPIAYLGRRIPLPRHNLLSWPARSFNAAPQFLNPTRAVPPHESISVGGRRTIIQRKGVIIPLLHP